MSARWRPPEGLDAPVPRAVRMTGSYSAILGVTLVVLAFIVVQMSVVHKPLNTIIPVALIVLLGGGTLTFIVLNPLLRDKRLLRKGQATQARILSEEDHIAAKGGRYSSIKYSFTDAAGNTIHGVCKYGPAEDDNRGEVASRRFHMFDNPTVLFDPRDSSNNILYPPSTVELRQRNEA